MQYWIFLTTFLMFTIELLNPCTRFIRVGTPEVRANLERYALAEKLKVRAEGQDYSDHLRDNHPGQSDHQPKDGVFKKSPTHKVALGNQTCISVGAVLYFPLPERVSLTPEPPVADILHPPTLL